MRFPLRRASQHLAWAAFSLAGPWLILAFPQPSTSAEAATEQLQSTSVPFAPRPVTSWLEAQIVLARRGFSSGSIDGIAGLQSAAALRAFQSAQGLNPNGQLNSATRAELVLATDPFEQLVLSVEEFAQFQPLKPTWLGKSQQIFLGYENALEWAAERSHAHPTLIRQLNSDVNWEHVLPGAKFRVPAVGRPTVLARAALIRIQLGSHVLEAENESGDIIAHFPVSIARRVEKRPEGQLHVTVVIPYPDYTFDPEVFPESAEARELGRKLHLPPGPNNPVGVAWIGLDLPGYGIHGTPLPEKVGRTESHGCFRLANWDAATLLDLVWVGMPVIVQP